MSSRVVSVKYILFLFLIRRAWINSGLNPYPVGFPSQSSFQLLRQSVSYAKVKSKVALLLRRVRKDVKLFRLCLRHEFAVDAPGSATQLRLP
jgi:hypothetical protein